METGCGELELGTSDDGMFTGYRALVADEAIYLTPGEQGAQHIVLAFRGRGFDPSSPLLEVRLLRDGDCAEVGRLRVRFSFEPDPADASRLALRALRVVLLDNDDPLEYCSVLGAPIHLAVELLDSAGVRVEQRLRVLLADIDPRVRPDLRRAWLDACASRADAGTDAGVTDAGAPDTRPDAALDAD